MIKSIVTNINELRKPCEEVIKSDNYKSIIQDLKDTLTKQSFGIGLAANQIGYNKKICYLRIPTDAKKTNYTELIMINPVIVAKEMPIRFNGEGCLSFPGVAVVTKRFSLVIVKFLDENFKEQTQIFQGISAIAAQHEIDHLCGMTILDRKWRTK